jgi:phosphoribosyl 1,2-cyclic phosphodiesterase
MLMQVTFFGTCGSLPVPGSQTERYGGNTSCVAIRSAGSTLVVLDMGTGAYALGRELAASGNQVRGHVLISYTHWDHIPGLPFFASFFRPGNEWDVHAPRGSAPLCAKRFRGRCSTRTSLSSLSSSGRRSATTISSKEA